MTTILGISAFYHDSAAAILVDGVLMAAAQEERFSRIKHDPSFPVRSIEFCLDAAGIDIDAIDHVVFYEKPLRKLERLLETFLVHAPHGYGSFRTAIPVWLKEKLYQSRHLERGLGNQFSGRLVFVEHHLSHAASAFYTSPFDRAAILSADGVGEWATTSLGTGQGNLIELSEELHFPDSIGLLYSAFTAFCGFRVNGGEGKLMGLAPYGSPVYRDLIKEELLDLKDDGSFRLNAKYFDFVSDHALANPAFAKLFGGPPRVPESEITQREMDLAASIQAVTETILLSIACYLRKQTGERNLCLSGGVALNCVANNRLRTESGFENVWIPSAPGDAGAAVGAAFYVWHQLLNEPRIPNAAAPSAFLGPSNENEDIANVLNELDLVGKRYASFDDLALATASMLSDQKVVAWVQGAMEFGPRALGNRSILADPRSSSMRQRVNESIKRRETFRPFAPAIVEQQACDYFEIDQASPLMTFAVQTKNAITSPEALRATTHLDGTARVQTVTQTQNPRFYHLLTQFEKVSGCPALLNTSFNVRGEPMIRSTAEAMYGLLDMNIDALVIGDFLIDRDSQPSEALARCRTYLDAQRVTYQEHTQVRSREERLKRSSMESARRSSPIALAWSCFSKAIAWVTFPIRRLVSELVLLILFFGVFTTIGAIVRLTNRDSFQAIDRKSNSYWRKRKAGPADQKSADFTTQAQLPRVSLAREFFDFLRTNKKWWITPIVVILIVMSVLIVLTNSAIAPFIYVLF